MQTVCAGGMFLTLWQRRVEVTLGCVFLLTGCGGGGGGGGGGVAPTPFTSYGSIVYPSTVKMSGSSQEVSYTYSATGSHTFTGLSSSTSSSTASITNTLNASGTRTSETLTSGATLFTLSSPLDTINQTISGINVIYGSSANGQIYLLEADHAAFTQPWNYQNFGVWLTGAGTSSGKIGAISVGAETSGAAVPTTLTSPATFTGVVAGYYIDTTGAGAFVTATMSATWNPSSATTLAFSTSNSKTYSSPTAAGTLNSDLNMTGTLTYSAGSNQFTGSVSTSTGALVGGTGSATGKFYGPSAEEIGGTFSITKGTVGGGGAAYIGGFGGKR